MSASRVQANINNGTDTFITVRTLLASQSVQTANETANLMSASRLNADTVDFDNGSALFLNVWSYQR